MPLRSFILTLLSLAWACGCATVATKTPSAVEDELALLLKWFPGRYDSAAQTANDIAKNTPKADRNYRRHSIFRRIDLPAFGDIVFFAHQYRDGDPTQVYRQRLYSFTVDEAEDAFVLRVHVPKNTDAFKGAYRNVSKLTRLTPDDFTVWDGCDLYWRYETDRFVGRLKPGACRFASDAFGQDIVLEETLTLMEDQIRFADRGLSLDGDYLFGMRGDAPNISLKVRPFICETPAGDVWLHDQGGEGTAGPFTIRMQRWRDDARGFDVTFLQKGQAPNLINAPRDTVRLYNGDAAAPIDCAYAPKSLYSERR